MIIGSDIQKKIQQIKMKNIIKNGELFMFDAKLTKKEHEQIKQNFEKMIEENTAKVEQTPEILPQDNDATEFEKLINLKNNLSN